MKGRIMNSEILFFIIAGIASALFAIYEFFYIITSRGKTAKTEGTAVDIQVVDQGRCKGKRARFSYQINGTFYTSENSLKIPMTAQTGYRMEVRYFVDRPQSLFCHSVQRMSVAIAIAAACLFLTLYYR